MSGTDTSTPAVPCSVPVVPLSNTTGTGVTLTTEVIVEVAPAEATTIDKLFEQEALRLWRQHPGRDIVPMLRRYQHAICDDAAEAAAVLADENSSGGERQAAAAVLHAFMGEQLRHDDKQMQRRFDRWLVKHIGTFDGEPLWSAVIKELLAGNWRRCTYGWPLIYLRAAINATAFRWYRDQARELRREVAYDEWLDEDLIPVLDRRDMIGTRGHENGGKRGSARACQPIHKPGTPAEYQLLEIEIDLKNLLTKADVGGDVATLLSYRVLDGVSDVEIKQAEGWSDSHLEAVQARWRQTARSRVHRVCVAGHYAPTPADQEWKKLKNSRAIVSATRSKNSPHLVEAQHE